MKKTLIISSILLLTGFGIWKGISNRKAPPKGCPVEAALEKAKHDGETTHAHAGESADAHAGESAGAHDGEPAGAHAGEPADAHAGEGKVELSSEQRQTVGLTVIPVEFKPLSEVLELTGSIPEEPSDLISAMPSEPCVLSRVTVNVGERVNKGSILAIGKTESGDPITLRSPRSGTVLAVTRKAGETADTFSPAVLLADLTTLTLSLSATTEDASNLKVGQKVEAFHPTTRSDRHSGWITTISPRVDPETRLVRVAAKVDNSNGHLRLGMFLTANVHIQSGKSVLSVSEEAVLRVNGADTVYLQDPDDEHAFIPTVVKTGEHRGGRVAILSGLKAGARVAGSGTFYLKSEQMKGSMSEDSHGH